MKIIKELEQNTQEWLNFRDLHIGTSDAPIIMGISPWKTPHTLWLDKIGAGEKEETNFYMNRGIDLEPIALQEYNKMTGFNCVPKIAVSSTYDFLSASFDGFDIEKKCAVEIKCPGEKDHLSAVEGTIPAKYYPQLQHQMFVSELQMIDYFSFDGQDGVIVKVPRDDQYIEDMLQKEFAFWGNVESLTAPEKTDKDYIEGDDAWIAQAKKVYRLQIEEKSVKKLKEQAMQKLKDGSEGSTRGGGIRLSKYKIKGRVKYGDIPELKGINLEKYRDDDFQGWKLSLEKK